MSKTVAAFVKVASVADLGSGKMMKVQVAGKDVLLANVDGKYYAIGNLCTHEDGPLDEGVLTGHDVECPWHSSRFDLRNGHVTNGPADTPEPTYEVKVEAGQILLKQK